MKIPCVEYVTSIPRKYFSLPSSFISNSVANLCFTSCFSLSSFPVTMMSFWRGGVGLVAGAFEENCGVGASRGFIRKMRGKTRTHLMRICFNSRGRFMKIIEIVAKRKPLVLVVPEGVKGNGWETLRKAISSVQDLSDQAIRASKEMLKESQVSKGMYRGGQSYVNVVAEKGPRNRTLMPVGKWASAVICESKGKVLDWFDIGKAIARMMGTKGMVSVTPISNYKGCFFMDSARRANWFQDQGSLTMRGGVVALRRWSPKEDSIVFGNFRRGWLELRGLPFHLWEEVKLWVEMLPNVVLPALLEVEDGAWDELMSAGGCVFQRLKNAEGLRATAKDNECHSWRPRHRSHSRSSDSNSASKVEKGRGGRPSLERRVLGPLAGPIHEIEAGSSNGGPVAPSSSKLQCSGSFANELPSLNVSPSVPKRNQDGGGSSEANEAILRGRSVSNKAFFLLFQKPPKISPGKQKETKGFHVASKASSPKPKPLTLPLEGFQVEGLTPRKLVKVQSILESLRIRIVRDNGKGAEVESKSTLSADKDCFCLHEDLKLEYKRIRRFVSSVWKGRSMEWVALPTCEASGGIVILWDSNKFKCTKKVLGSFSVTVKLNSGEEGSFWLTLVYGPNKPLWRKDVWLELQDLYGLTFPRWCVRGDFNVIRRISEKMGDSRLTFNMRCFDEFIRESGLLDSPLRNAAFTWSNMFENMWLLHPEFKEKFRDWWQECTVEG
ncbi:hypothetical protein CK203_050954 [Vitis vinifera]|uniref:Uncharacterized protein n=1 Tax=Vitis vinifera TaxID=29760 RepID=A0A438H381_VITVI|nr:hypothetical protein CK203_050954 [Vitis vinifera]